MIARFKSRIGRLHPWWRRFKRNGYRPDRCDECGHGFHWNRDSRNSFGNRDGKTWHSPCIALVVARGKAQERLRVLGVVVDLTGVTADDVRQTMSLRAPTDGYEASNEWNVGWRVFYDLEKSA